MNKLNSRIEKLEKTSAPIDQVDATVAPLADATDFSARQEKIKFLSPIL